MRRLEQAPAEEEVLSYADAIGMIRVTNQTRRRTKRVMRGAYTIPLPPRGDGRYVTVEFDYAGDFGETKDPFSNVLSSLHFD